MPAVPPVAIDDAGKDKPLLLYTLGHADLSPQEFLELLGHFGIEQVIDVRAAATSRQSPHFDKSVLSPFLRIRRIRYLHLKDLGGLRRRPLPDSTNAGWRNAALRGFADYMQTPPFTNSLMRLVHLSGLRLTAILCSEPLPWRCHRLLIADALTVREIRVIHIISQDEVIPHALSPMAHVDGTRVTYPSGPHPHPDPPLEGEGS